MMMRSRIRACTRVVAVPCAASRCSAPLSVQQQQVLLRSSSSSLHRPLRWYTTDSAGAGAAPVPRRKGRPRKTAATAAPPPPTHGDTTAASVSVEPITTERTQNNGNNNKKKTTKTTKGTKGTNAKGTTIKEEKASGEGPSARGGGGGQLPSSVFAQTRRLEESELMEKFVKGGGPGGQKINKTNNCVYLKHIPTGLEVKCQEQRERSRNRTIARQILHEKLMQMYFPEESKSFQKQEKIRRRKERMSRRYGRKPVSHHDGDDNGDDDEEVEKQSIITDASDASDGGQMEANEAKPRSAIPKGRAGHEEAMTKAARGRKPKTADGPSELFAAVRNATASKEDTHTDVAIPRLWPASLPRRDQAGKRAPARGKRVDADSLPDFVFTQLGMQREEAMAARELDDQDIDYDDDEEDEEDDFEDIYYDVSDEEDDYEDIELDDEDDDENNAEYHDEVEEAFKAFLKENTYKGEETDEEEEEEEDNHGRKGRVPEASRKG